MKYLWCYMKTLINGEVICNLIHFIFFSLSSIHVSYTWTRNWIFWQKREITAWTSFLTRIARVEAKIFQKLLSFSSSTCQLHLRLHFVYKLLSKLVSRLESSSMSFVNSPSLSFDDLSVLWLITLLLLLLLLLNPLMRKSLVRCNSGL